MSVARAAPSRIRRHASPGHQSFGCRSTRRDMSCAARSVGADGLGANDEDGRVRLVRDALADASERSQAGALGGAEAVGRNAAEMVARGDVELPEDLAQVVLNRSGADEQL